MGSINLNAKDLRNNPPQLPFYTSIEVLLLNEIFSPTKSSEHPFYQMAKRFLEEAAGKYYVTPGGEFVRIKDPPFSSTYRARIILNDNLKAAVDLLRNPQEDYTIQIIGLQGECYGALCNSRGIMALSEKSRFVARSKKIPQDSISF